MKHIQRWLDFVKPYWDDGYVRFAARLCLQTVYCLFLLGCAIHLLEPYMADYMTACACEQAAFENIPGVLVSGMLAVAARGWIVRQNTL